MSNKCEKREGCNFCGISEIVLNKKTESLPYVNKPVFLSKNFFLIQAKHKINNGHILLITSEHYFRFSELAKEEFSEFLNVFDSIYSALQRSFNNINVFEHGLASDSPSQCVEHAHIHFLPIDKKISDILKDKFELTSTHDTLDEVQRNLHPPYILIKENSDKWKIFKISDSIPSQYVCRLYSKAIGKSENSWLNIKGGDAPYKKSWEQLREIFKYEG